MWSLRNCGMPGRRRRNRSASETWKSPQAGATAFGGGPASNTSFAKGSRRSKQVARTRATERFAGAGRIHEHRVIGAMRAYPGTRGAWRGSCSSQC
jgi:hypothetical protein